MKKIKYVYPVDNVPDSMKQIVQLITVVSTPAAPSDPDDNGDACGQAFARKSLSVGFYRLRWYVKRCVLLKSHIAVSIHARPASMHD